MGMRKRGERGRGRREEIGTKWGDEKGDVRRYYSGNSVVGRKKEIFEGRREGMGTEWGGK